MRTRSKLSVEEQKARKAVRCKRRYNELTLDPERYARFKAQQRASYHKRKGSWKERERRDRYNASRRSGPARGYYAPREAAAAPPVHIPAPAWNHFDFEITEPLYAKSAQFR